MDFLSLLNQRLVFFDGATGTELYRKGLPPGDCPEEFNLTNLELVREIHRSYREVGADVVTTNTLGANAIKLAKYGLEDRIDEINRAAVTAVKDAVSDGGLAAGSIGPTGEMLKPYGTLDPQEALEAFSRQVQAMRDADVDLFIIETMLDLNEAEIAVKAAAEAGEIPVVACITFQVGPAGARTIMGNSPADAVGPLLDAGAAVIGSNCGGGPDEMRVVIEEFHKATDSPLIAQPNAGIPRIENGETVFPATPDEMAEAMAGYPDLGVRAIGGCCGTGPEHLRRIFEQFDR